MNTFLLKEFTISFFVLATVFTSCSKKDTDSSSINSFSIDQIESDLPYVKITTQNFILNEPKVMANMEVFEKGERTFSSPIGIEGIQFKGNISSPIICKTDNDFVKKILYLYNNHLVVKKKIKPFINEYRQQYSASIATKNFYKMIINKL